MHVDSSVTSCVYETQGAGGIERRCVQQGQRINAELAFGHKISFTPLPVVVSFQDERCSSTAQLDVAIFKSLEA